MTAKSKHNDNKNREFKFNSLILDSMCCFFLFYFYSYDYFNNFKDLISMLLNIKERETKIQASIHLCATSQWKDWAQNDF